MTPFTVIIATCGRPERLAVTLDCIRHAIEGKGRHDSVIVVDNHDDHTAETIVSTVRQKAAFPVRYLRTEPFNKCVALNAGIAAADTEWLAFTDDDTCPDSGWLASAQAFAQETRCRFFGGHVNPGQAEAPVPWHLRQPDGGTRWYSGGVFVHYQPLPESGLLGETDQAPIGANAFAGRSLFEDHGTYDEDLWRSCGRWALGVDDGEFGIRVKRTGEPVGYCREAIVVHPVYADKYPLRRRIRNAYAYGWREPVLLAEENDPWFARYKLRALLGCVWQGIHTWCQGDHPLAVDLWLRAFGHAGRITGRWSRFYREYGNRT